jgi:hypothetical protein
MLAQHLFGDMAKGNRDNHALTTWLQTRVTAVDMDRYGWSLDGADDGQPDLPSSGHAELPGGGQRDYLV